jgi:hypothetical protein
VVLSTPLMTSSQVVVLIDCGNCGMCVYVSVRVGLVCARLRLWVVSICLSFSLFCLYVCVCLHVLPFQTTAESALHKAEKEKQKKKRAAHSFGWDVFNDDAKFRSYKKRLTALPGRYSAAAVAVCLLVTVASPFRVVCAAVACRSLCVVGVSAVCCCCVRSLQRCASWLSRCSDCSSVMSMLYVDGSSVMSLLLHRWQGRRTHRRPRGPSRTRCCTGT